MSTVFHSMTGSPVVSVGIPDNQPLPVFSPPAAPAPRNRPASKRPLHRLAAVRRQEGVSRRTMARRLGITVKEVQEQEQAGNDLPLSVLYRWQEVLNVPVSELFDDASEGLSRPVMLRAQLLRIMKTVVTLKERAKQVSVQRMVQMLAEQLLDVMPELKEATAWPSVGRRRSTRELGQVIHRRLPTDLACDLEFGE